MTHAPRTAARRGAARRGAALGAAALLALAVAGCSGGDGESVDVTPSSTSPSATATADGSTPPTPSATADPSAPQESPAPDASQTAQGAVVPDLPQDVIPVPDDAEVLLTSAVPDGDMLDVSLSARIAATPEDVIGLYRTALTGAGFVESPSAAGATASTFTRSGGAEVVTVTVVPATTPGGLNTYTVGGTVLGPAR